MARIGAFCFPATGHLNPLTALGRRLQQRGHSFVIFGVADVESRVRSAGIDFCLIGQSDYPPGTLNKLDLRMSQLKGLKTFHFTVERIKNTANMVLRDGPEAVRRENIDALLIDETDFSGSIADYLGLPFISMALIPPMLPDNRMPPFFFPWPPGQDWLSRLRNEFGIRLLTRIGWPVYKVVNKHRTTWGLKPFAISADALSTLAQFTQLPAALEFDIPIYDSHPLLHYTGPWVDAHQRPKIDFDWDRLDGRPLVYASLGTLQNGSENIFRTIAAACADLPVQLVLSLGGGLDPARLGVLRGDPIVVPYAPQLELVKRAAIVITHAGINTALESLSEGVPMVCIPIGNDQPGIAARVAARGAGIVVPMRKLNAKRLHSAVSKVLEDDSYRQAARKLQASIQQIDGLDRAADVVEDVFQIRKSVRA